MKDIKERINTLLGKLNEIENDNKEIYNLTQEHRKDYQKKSFSGGIENRINYDAMKFLGFIIEANDYRIEDIKKNIRLIESLMNNSQPFFRLKHDIILLDKIFYSPRIKIGSFEYDKRDKYYIRFFHKDNESLAIVVDDAGYEIEVSYAIGFRKSLPEMNIIGKIFMDPKNYTDEYKMFKDNIFDKESGSRFLINILKLIEILPGLSEDDINKVIDGQILLPSETLNEEYFKTAAKELGNRDISIIYKNDNQSKELNLEFTCNKIENPVIDKMAENKKKNLEIFDYDIRL